MQFIDGVASRRIAVELLSGWPSSPAKARAPYLAFVQLQSMAMPYESASQGCFRSDDAQLLLSYLVTF